MGFFDSDEDNTPDPKVDEFNAVASEMQDAADSSQRGLAALQDVYNSYDFTNPVAAKNAFVTNSDQIRKKFGDTKAYDYDKTLQSAPVDFSDIKSDVEDPDGQKLDLINQWETKNLESLDNTDDPTYLQSRSQLERGIKQTAAMQRRDYYGKDNYIVSDLALRAAQGAVGPLADLVGADSVNDFFTEQTNPDRDDSFWSGLASGAGSAVAAVGAGVATGGWGTVAYLGASGAGQVVKQVRDSVNNEGSVGEALEAGGIEAVSQVAQVAAGEKILGGVADAILGQSSKLGAKIFPRIVAEDAAISAISGSGGRLASNIATNVGENKDDDIMNGVVQAGLVGGTIGAVAGAYKGHVEGQRPETLNEDISINKTTTESNPATPESNPATPESNPATPESNPATPESNPATADSSNKEPSAYKAMPYDSVSEKILNEKYSDHVAAAEQAHQALGDKLLGNSVLNAEPVKGGQLASVDVNPDSPTYGVPVLNVKNIEKRAKAEATKTGLTKEQVLPILYEEILKHENVHAEQVKRGHDFEAESGIRGRKNTPTEKEALGVANDSTVRQRLAELKQSIADVEGTPPPAPETIPAGRQSVDFDYAKFDAEYNTAMGLDDGSQLIDTGDSIHLQKDGKTLQPYEKLTYVTPENAKKIRWATQGHGPDGTAITLTTDGTNLLAESDFLNTDLSIATDKTGVSRRVVPTEDTPDGNVPVLVSKTRTTDGVRQNPFMIAPGTVTDSASAAKAGFGGQKESQYLTKLREKYGPDTSNELGLATTQYEENIDGTVTSKEIPLHTYFPISDTETGNEARDFLSKNGLYKSMDHLQKQESFTNTDKAVAATISDTLENAYFKAVDAGHIDDQVKYGGLLLDAQLTEAKGIGEAGRVLRQGRQDAREAITGKTSGDLSVNLLKTELLRQASEEFKKETGEPIDLSKMKAEVDVAKKNLAEASKGVKEGEPVDPNTQNQINKAKKIYDQKAEKIRKAQSKLNEKLSKFSPEDQKSVKDLTNVLKTVAPGTMQQAVAEKIHEINSKHITRDSSTNMFDRVFNFYRSNLLSGPATEYRSITGHISNAISTTVGLMGSGEFKLAGKYASEWLKATPQSLRNAAEIIKGNREGTFQFDQKLIDKGGNLSNRTKLKSDIPSINPLDHPLTFIQNTMFRLLKAQYGVFHRNAESAMAYLAEEIAHKNESNPALRRELVENALYRSPQKLQEITDSINNQVDTLKKAGITLSDREIQNAKAELMEQSRSERTREIAGQHGDRATFSNDPKGIAGGVYDLTRAISNWASVDIGGTKVSPLKFVLPFTRVASNIMSHVMEFTPNGIIKSIANNPEGKTGIFNHGMSALDAKISLGRGIVGSTILGGFMSLAYAYKDDKDPFIQFYGYPDSKEYKQWQAAGIQPFSMKIGNTIIPLQSTSLAIIPAILAGAMKNIKSGGSVEDVIKAISLSSLGAVSTMSFLKPAGDLFDHIVASKDQITTETGSSAKKNQNFWLGQADTLATGFIPASGFLNNLGRWSNANPVETYNNLSAKLLGEMPFTQSLGLTDKRPQLNMFGEPIEKPLIERLSAGLALHTIKTDPVLLWMQETGYNITDQGPILRLSTAYEKEAFSEDQKKNTGYADILNEAQSRKVLEITGPQIKDFLKGLKDDPDFQVLNKRNQEYINTYVNKIRASAKYDVLSNN